MTTFFNNVNSSVNDALDTVFQKIDTSLGTHLCEFDAQNDGWLKTAVKVGVVVLGLVAVAGVTYALVHALPVVAVGAVGLGAKHAAVHTVGCLAAKHAAVHSVSHTWPIPPHPPHPPGPPPQVNWTGFGILCGTGFGLIAGVGIVGKIWSKLFPPAPVAVAGPALAVVPVPVQPAESPSLCL